MILFKKAQDLSQFVHQNKLVGRQIGFIPTMGALHQGHLSLIAAGKVANDLTVCSVFINPAQFNNSQDYQLYPVTIESDIEKLTAGECDVLFLPSEEEIYPPGYLPRHYNLGELELLFEGHYRPGHFQGVCQVMDRLLTLVRPDNLYLGAKDYQQCKVITKLAQLQGYGDEVRINIRPTLREPDGLAMSSRNMRLNANQRQAAPALYKSLQNLAGNFGQKPVATLEQEGKHFLQQHGFKVDYLAIVDADTLYASTENTRHEIVVAAAFLDDIRLIDNLQLNW